MYNRYELAAEIMNLAYLKLSMADQAYANLDKLSVAGQIDAATLAQARQNLNRLKLISSESEIEFNKASAELTELFKSNAKDIHIAIDRSSLDNAIKKVGLESNLDVQLSISELELAKLELAAIQSSGWGNLSFNLQADVPVSDSDDDSDLSIGLIFSKVLGDGGRLKATTKVAKLKVDRSTESVRYNEQNAEISLLTLRQQISRLEKSIKLRDEMITDAYLNVQQLEEQLLIGMSNFSAVLDAHVGLFTLEKDQLVDTGDLVASKLNILAQHGNLLELFNLSLPLEID
jgi:outer membrane protein TolC